MTKHGAVTIAIDRRIEAVFDFLADGQNNLLFSEHIIEIAKTTDGPPGIGTIYRSTARAHGRTAIRVFEITEFERPIRIRWRECSQGLVAVSDGGYELRDRDGGTELTFDGSLKGHRAGKLILGFVSRRVRAGFPEFAQTIKQTIEESV